MGKDEASESQSLSTVERLEREAIIVGSIASKWRTAPVVRQIATIEARSDQAGKPIEGPIPAVVRAANLARKHGGPLRPLSPPA